MEPANYFHRYL